MATEDVMRYRCTVCGYIHEGDTAPDTCPVCKVPKDKFEPVEQKVSAVPSRWHCTICGYVHEGAAPPELCPICGVEAGLFESVAAETHDDPPEDYGKVIIIGAGIAGLSAAEAICRRTARVEITLISLEDEVPYYRLNLTRYLAGEIGRDDLPIRTESWYSQKGITLLRGKAVKRIDRYGRVVTLASGEMLQYDRLILATGAEPFVPPISGIELPGVFTVRTATDVDRILEANGDGRRIACIGGGILGLEIAGALNRRNADVSVISLGAGLMPRQLTQDASDILQKQIESIGITIISNASTTSITQNDSMLQITLEDGRAIDVDLVMVAVGVKPNLDLAKASGLEVNRGIIVNDMMKTSDSVVFAAGDVTEQHSVVYGHWHPAMLQGAVAGTNSTGGAETFDGVPPTTVIKVLGIGMFSAGQFNQTLDEQIRLSGSTNNAYYDLLFDNDRLIGANEIGDVSLSATLTHLIENHVDLSKHLGETVTLDSMITAIKAME